MLVHDLRVAPWRIGMPSDAYSLPSASASPGPRADRWTLRTRTLALGRRPLLMGILNVTPDSFSDGGAYADPAAAIDHGLRLVADGADILDIGGESTRPYSMPVDVREELDRVLPVVRGLCRAGGVPVSIDTSKAAVAREAIDAGAEIINDVTALQGDPEMLSVAVATGAGVCVMHMLGNPQTMQVEPAYENVVEEVLEYLRRRRDALLAAGIPGDRVAVDPGIGFGKRTQHNLELLSRAGRLHELGCPVLVGHSRKGFINRVLDDDRCDRTAGTIGVSLALARQGVQVLRVHDVKPVCQALVLFEAAGGYA
jgi:dihydropteroate synthase